MLFNSTEGKCAPVSFREAVLGGLAPDGGLWMPESIPVLSRDFFFRLPALSLPEIGFEIAKHFTGEEISYSMLRQLIERAIDFDAPLLRLSENLAVLELFHGPTAAFKDFGARFLARILAHLQQDSTKLTTVLVATSGDTGSAVAHGFYRVEGTRVVLLYPSGKISLIQEKQMATLGENIVALEVAGNFDDCQRLVKQAFQDQDLKAKLQLSSANSINIARLLPQCFYYFSAFSQAGSTEPVISVPSGNFGNLTAGLLAKRMGLPILRFVAATNINRTVPEYLESGVFRPHESHRTLSNAMDVGNPSNFARMLALYDRDSSRMKMDISGSSFTDDETLAAIRAVYEEYRYVCDPHTAIAYLGLQQKGGIFLATAHPGKFPDIVRDATGVEPELPGSLLAYLNRPKLSIQISNQFDDLKSFLLGLKD